MGILPLTTFISSPCEPYRSTQAVSEVERSPSLAGLPSVRWSRGAPPTDWAALGDTATLSMGCWHALLLSLDLGADGVRHA